MHRSKRVDGDLIMMGDYEPRSDATIRRMLASATGRPLPYLSDACS
jgi:hypothetical protein